MLCMLLCKQFSRASAKPAFSALGFWGLSQQQEAPNNKRIPAGWTTLQQGSCFLHSYPVPFALQKLQTVSFLPDKPQGFHTDWSQFWKGRDISNCADLGLEGCCGALASLQPARWSMRVCVCACVRACLCVCLSVWPQVVLRLPWLFCSLLQTAVLHRLTRTVQLSQPQPWNFPRAGESMEFGLFWATEVERGACPAQESTMDVEPRGRNGSKPLRPGDPPDTRLLSNPLMGGESRGCGVRVLGRLVNVLRREERRGLGNFSGFMRCVHGAVTGQMSTAYWYISFTRLFKSVYTSICRVL